MVNPIHTLLADAESRLDRVERRILDTQREREVILAQIDAFKAAARAVDEAGGGGTPRKEASDALPRLKRFIIRPGQSNQWNRAFGTLHRRYRSGFGYDEIAMVAEELHISFQRPSLRTKMMNYVNIGVVHRVDNGRFSITDKGLSFFKIGDGSNENGGLFSPPDADEVTASSNT